MGFAAGFGRGFASSFQRKRASEEIKAQDDFRYRMETLIKKKADWDTKKGEYDKNVNLAKDLVQTYDVDPQAVAQIANMLNNGMDKGEIHKMIAGGEFSLDEAVQVAPDVEAQTEESMVNPAQPKVAAAPTIEQTAPEQPAQQDATGGGLFERLGFGNPKNRGKDRMARTDQRVQETTGMTPEEIAQYDTGFSGAPMEGKKFKYTPNADPKDAPSNLIEAQQAYSAAEAALAADPQNPALQTNLENAKRVLKATASGTTGEARAKLGIIGQQLVVHNGESVMGNVTAEGPILDAEGNELTGARVILEEEMGIAENIRNKIGELQTKHDGAASELAQTYTSFGIVEQIGKDNPLIFQKRTSEMTRWLVDIGQDVAAGSDMIVDFLQNPEANATPETLKALENEQARFTGLANDPKLSPEKKLAAARALVNAQYAIAAFHLAAAHGQEGKAMSNEERKLFMELPELATDYETWKNNVASILHPMKIALDKQADMIPRSGRAGEFFEDYGWEPVGKFNTVDKYLEGTVGADLDRILPKIGQSGVKIKIGGDQPEQNPPSGPETKPWTDTGEIDPKTRRKIVIVNGKRKLLPEGME